MITKNELLKSIREFEKNPQSYNDIEKLATFYIVYNQLFAEQPIVHYQLNEQQQELDDIFPALHEYQTERSRMNLQRLCNEIVEFIQSVYASTIDKEERLIFKDMADKIKKIGGN